MIETFAYLWRVEWPTRWPPLGPPRSPGSCFVEVSLSREVDKYRNGVIKLRYDWSASVFFTCFVVFFVLLRDDYGTNGKEDADSKGMTSLLVSSRIEWIKIIGIPESKVTMLVSRRKTRFYWIFAIREDNKMLEVFVSSEFQITYNPIIQKLN